MMAGQGENNLAVLADDQYMTEYWETAKLLMERYAELDSPAVVHLEPDFWAFAQRASDGDPASIPAQLHPDCRDLPQDISGVARCWFKLARDNAPKVVIGLHASEWAGDSGTAVGEFLVALGSAESDIVVIDILDRDAGCFEEGTLPQCMRGGRLESRGACRVAGESRRAQSAAPPGPLRRCAACCVCSRYRQGNGLPADD
jgi:hypothetical protein